MRIKSNWYWIIKAKKGDKGTVSYYATLPRDEAIKYKWTVNIHPLPTYLKNYIFCRYHISKIKSERSLNIILKAYVENKRIGFNNNYLMKIDPDTREIFPLVHWRKNIKDTIKDSCMDCGKEIRISSNKYNINNFRCKDCISKNLKVNNKVYIIKANNLKDYNLKTIERKRKSLLNISKNSTSAYQFKLEGISEERRNLRKIEVKNLILKRKKQKKISRLKAKREIETKHIRKAKRDIIEKFLKSKNLIL